MISGKLDYSRYLIVKGTRGVICIIHFLGSEDNIFPVKNYESAFNLTNIPQFFESSANENIIRIFNNYINKHEGQSNDTLNNIAGKIPLWLRKIWYLISIACI